MKDQSYYDKLQDLVNQDQELESFRELKGIVREICLGLGLQNQEQIDRNLSKLWLPLALDLAKAKKELNRTFIQGILGGQGTGKSTLCIILKVILDYLGISAANLSIDDLYLTHAERKELKQQDPRLIWRGPPGTHDVELGLQTIQQCLEGDDDSDILIPRFDKSAHNGSGDRTAFETIKKPDILLFEGWFVGVKPIKENCFDNCPHPILSPEDIKFAKDNNKRLQAYLPLWNKLDNLIVLYPEDYRLSQQWRKDAEQKMMALGKTGMSDEEIDRFVEYFWKSLHPDLFIKPLLKSANLIVEIKSDRTLGNIHHAE